MLSWGIIVTVHYKSVFVMKYRILSNISPSAYMFQRLCLVGLYSGELIFGRCFAFERKIGDTNIFEK